MPDLASIAEIIGRTTIPTEEQAVIVSALLSREDEIGDRLRSVGQQFGLYPEIVAESLAEVGLGTPLSDEERALIRQGFINLMERLRNQQ